jgi:DNA-binding Lrp family transcriptional regulator
MGAWYVSALAGGGGAGTEISPWTLAEMVTNINNATVLDDDTVYVKADGTYTTTGVTITQAVTANHTKTICGYTSSITDGGQATIQRSSGTTQLVTLLASYIFQNFILDGNSLRGHGVGGASAICINVESKNNTSPGNGFNIVGCCFNCYSHDNGYKGFAGVSVCINCIAYNNAYYGYVTCSTCINCIGKNNTNYNWFLNGTLMNCISDGGSLGGILVTAANCIVINAIIVNVTANKYGLEFQTTTTKCGIFYNIDFYNFTANYDSNNIAKVINPYYVNPNFINSGIYNYTRADNALDDLGFSKVGCQTFDYKIDIGIDQKITPQYPAATDVRKLISFAYGIVGSLDLPAVADVRDSTKFDNETKEGILDLPAVADVKDGVWFDNGTKEGILEVPVPDFPSEDDVRDGVNFDDGDKEGKLNLPSEDDVRDGILFDQTTKEGNLELPDITEVKKSVGFGTDGTEFIGTADLKNSPSGFAPSFRLYAADETSLEYTFPLVQATNAPQSVKKSSEIKGIRGIGSIIISGSEESWELYLKFILLDADYTAVEALIDELEAAVVLHEKYYLEFDKSPSESYTYKVKRISPIEYNDSLRIGDQEVTIKLLVNAW